MKNTFLFFLLLFSFSCSSTDSTLVIDPRTFVENKITLDEIADDITYIPIDNSIPFTNFKYVITPKSIYIAAKGISILKFDRDGKLIQRIGSQGRGPGEFILGMDFTVDEKTGNIYVLDPRKIKAYSQNGVFLRDIEYDKFLKPYPTAGGIEFYNSLLLLPDYNMSGLSEFNWVFLDTLGNLVSSKENSVPHFQAKIVWPGSIYLFKDKFYYFNYFNDTIFSILPDLNSQKAYLFAQGDHRWPRKKIVQLIQLSTLFQPVQMFETKNFIVLRYYYHKNTAILLIDKRKMKTFLSITDSDSKASITNNLDGGMPLTDLNYYTEDDKEYFTALIEPVDVKLYAKSDEFKNIVPEHPEKKKQFEKLADSLNETDNPILIMVKLKR